MLAKYDFVDALAKFYIATTGSPDQISDLSYVQDRGEWVYVTYESGDQKRFCVTGDSDHGILIDFAKFLRYSDDYEWLRESEKR